MARLVIEDLDDEVMSRLEAQATARLQPVNELVRDIIVRSVPSRAAAAAAFSYARSLTPPGPQTDSTSMVRALRDE